MFILGISAWYHDSSACIIKDGIIIAAAQEERFTRKKHDASFPEKSAQYCIKAASISPIEIDLVVFYEKPFLKFERLLETYLAFAPRGLSSFSKAMPLWIKDKLFQKRKIIKKFEKLWGENIDWEKKLLFSEHHLSHSASAFFPSPFEQAAVLTLDGVGEWTTSSIAIGKGNDLKIIKEIYFPHSLGLLYSTFTSYIGFKVNSGEYKVMGLAPYGKPKYVDLIKNNLIDIKDDGSFRLDMGFFGYPVSLKMTNLKFNKLFGGPPRTPESEITQKHMDLAASIQKVTEEVFIKLAISIKKETNQKNLCLAGGVALNCVANGALLKEKIFENIWIQPASGDSGGSLGAALAVHYIHLKNIRVLSGKKDEMFGSFLGPSFNDLETEEALSDLGAKFDKLDVSSMIEKTADELVKGSAIGWMQGRMEFGPRALGARSIIADPRSKYMQKTLNLKVKYRESFRPFAPSVLFEHSGKWFELEGASPYMLFVANVKKNKQVTKNIKQKTTFGVNRLSEQRSIIPAVTHVDFSARIQTVHSDSSPLFHALISKFNDLTDCPLLINTSFNVRGEPIVCSPIDAYKCFMGTELDVLVIGNFILHKSNQPISLMESYKEKYTLD
jgi:carbamoyltransferase